MQEELIKVSVYCLTFNHEKYIRNTLEGFVNQKTDFKYEVFVHDDASTDGTKTIIHEFEEKYPDIIKPIYQSENQYSKGIKIVKTHIFPKMKGEYIAVCEGDDYWCDESKLQKQVDFLDNNPTYSACVHNTLILDLYHDTTRILNSSKEEYDLKIEHVLSAGGVDYHTSSLMYRMKYAEEIHRDNPPDFYTKPKKVGDYPMAIYLTLEGKVRFFPEVMSVYRFGTPGSWTKSLDDPLVMRETRYSIINMLKSVDEYTDYKLHETIQSIIDKNYLDILDKETNAKIFKEKDIQNVLKKLKVYIRIKIIIKVIFINKYRRR